MKKIKYLLFIILTINFSCENNKTERSIGFSNWSDDGNTYKWHLGTESAVDLVIDLDKVWAAQDYTEMRSYFADTAKFYFRDGRIFDNSNDFINEVSTQQTNGTSKWEFLGAYSVDLDPSRGGEHVQASFDLIETLDGISSKSELHEQYYIIDNKIVSWKQFSIPIN